MMKFFSALALMTYMINHVKPVSLDEKLIKVSYLPGL